MAAITNFEATGRSVKRARLIGFVYSTGRNAVTLAVIRPDIDRVGYKVHDRTPDGVLGIAKRDGLRVTGLHNMKDCPRWAQRRFCKLNGWQFNWHAFGWIVVTSKDDDEPDAETEAA